MGWHKGITHLRESSLREDTVRRSADWTWRVSVVVSGVRHSHEKTGLSTSTLRNSQHFVGQTVSWGRRTSPTITSLRLISAMVARGS